MFRDRTTDVTNCVDVTLFLHATSLFMTAAFLSAPMSCVLFTVFYCLLNIVVNKGIKETENLIFFSIISSTPTRENTGFGVHSVK